MTEESQGSASRRSVLKTAAAVAATGSLAGCAVLSDATSQEYEADWVSLEEGADADLALAGRFELAETVEREGEVAGVDGKVSITSKAVGYVRDLERLYESSELRPTLVGSFVDERNGGEYRGAVLVRPKFDPEEDETESPAPEVGGLLSGTVPEVGALLFPTGVVADIQQGREIADTSGVLAVYPPETMVENPTAPEGGGYVVPVQQFTPANSWYPEGNPAADPIDRGWSVGPTSEPMDSDGRVFVAMGERSPEEMFGVSATEMPGERVEAGESVGEDGTVTMVVTPATGGTFITKPETAYITKPETAYITKAETIPVPMGGVAYGVGALSTPNAEVGGESVSPLARMDMQELLTTDAAGQMIDVPGASGDEVGEWVVDPIEVDVDGNDEPPQTELLGESTDVTSFVGVLGDSNTDGGGWLTFVHTARTTTEGNAVVAAGSHTTPVGQGATADGDDIEIPGLGRVMAQEDFDLYHLQGGGFTGAVGKRFGLGMWFEEG